MIVTISLAMTAVAVTVSEIGHGIAFPSVFVSAFVLAPAPVFVLVLVAGLVFALPSMPSCVPSLPVPVLPALNLGIVRSFLHAPMYS